MSFIVYRCSKDPDYFIVTDAEHIANVNAELCPRGGALERIGEYKEMGESRVAFDEGLARNSIERQGYFRFEAKTFDPVATPPGTMPG